MKVEIYTSLNEELLSVWIKLWESSAFANINNSPGWLLSAIKAFGYKELKIIAIYNKNYSKLMAVAPFVKTSIYGLPFYTAPALEFNDRPQLLLDFKNKQLLKLLISEISKLGNVFIPNFTESLLKMLPKYSMDINIFKGDVSPYIDFSIGPYGILPSRKRNNVLNRLKNSEKKVELITVAEENLAALEKVFEIDTESVRQNNGKGVFYRKEARNFYKFLTGYYPSNVVITLMFVDATPVSYLVGFLNKGIYSGTQKAYMAGNEYFSPGKLLLIKLLDHYREKGIPEVDLGRGYDRFKKDFTHSYRQLFNVVISKNKLLILYIKGLHNSQNLIYKSITRYPLIYLTYRTIREKMLL